MPPFCPLAACHYSALWLSATILPSGCMSLFCPLAECHHSALWLSVTILPSGCMSLFCPPPPGCASPFSWPHVTILPSTTGCVCVLVLQAGGHHSALQALCTQSMLRPPRCALNPQAVHLINALLNPGQCSIGCVWLGHSDRKESLLPHIMMHATWHMMMHATWPRGCI